MHEARIASDVGSQYRRQPALDPDWPLLYHRVQSNPDAIVRRIRWDAHPGWYRLLALSGHALVLLRRLLLRVRRTALRRICTGRFMSTCPSYLCKFQSTMTRVPILTRA